MGKLKILVAVPAYNCQSQINRVIKQFVEVPEDIFYELLIIDNCSDDFTCEIAEDEIKLHETLRLTVVRNFENYGLGGSHKVAFKYCCENNFDGVVILHGDDQADLADFSLLLSRYESGTFDAVLGARFMPGASLKGYSLFRILGNYVFNALYSIGTITPLFDMGSGLNFYDKKLISDSLHFKMPDDLTFHGAYLLAMIAAKKKIKYVPISWREEDQVSNAKFFIQSVKLIHYLLMYIFNKTRLVSIDHRDIKRKNYSFDVCASTF